MIATLAALALLAASAAVGGDVAPPLEPLAPPRATPGWTRQANSLLLYGADETLAQELPLHSSEESGSTSSETLGGVSPDGRLAWTLDRRLVWTPGRTRVLESRRLLRVYGTSGQEAWRDDDADIPERGDGILFSADGQTMLVTRRGKEGWSAEARTWMGRPIAALGPFPKLISIALTPNGRYALARWSEPDKSDTHSFLDLKTRTRRDIPSSELVLGLARIGDDGVARSGSKVVFVFEPSSSTVQSPGAAPR